MKKLNLWLLARWEAQHSFGADTNISYAFVLGANNNISYEYRMYSAGGGLHNGYILTGTYQVSGQTINVTFTKLYISGDDTNGKEFNNTEFVKK